MNHSNGHLIAYKRVSSIDQNPSRQLNDIKGIHRAFIDFASGKDRNRPKLDECLKYVRDGDTLLVHSMDRLARNLNDLTTLVKVINEKGVTLKFIKENLTFTANTNDPMANLILAVVGAIAEFERSLIAERRQEGIELAKKAKKYTGRKNVLSEYQIKQLQQMVKDNTPKIKIAEQLNISRASVYNYIARALIS